MKIPLTKTETKLGSRLSIGIVVAVLLTAGAVGGWAISTMSTAGAVAVEDHSGFEALRRNMAHNVVQEPAHEQVKHGLIGSYAVTGTDSDGKPYARAGMLDIALAPSGALELAWDNGKQVGVGQLIGNVLVVASSTYGRTAIWIMTINPDGSLSGKWSRRTDRGYKGSETWKRT